MYKQVYYGRKSAILGLSIFVIFMAVFTFIDIPIVKAVFHYNDAYGGFFKIVGLLLHYAVLLYL